MNPPLVSILIPVYNCRAWVANAIRSALAQTWPNKEIIALDDVSTDRSWDILQTFSQQIHVERASRNGGQNVSRNRLTELSRGEWLVYLDADDELASDNIAQKLGGAAGADAIYGTMEMSYFAGDQITRSELFPAESFSDPFEAAFLWKYPNTSSFMFRKSVIPEAGGWNNAIKNCTDYDLYFRLLLRGKKLYPCPQSLTIYRQWSQTQATKNSERIISTRLEVMWKAALALERDGRLTANRRDAFASATLSLLRSLYHINMEKAFDENRRLISSFPEYRPRGDMFPASYCALYKMLGFRFAEKIADFLRPFKWTSGNFADRNRAS
jgi:glycosyltransferase involved in cell wall biosynthesis